VGGGDIKEGKGQYWTQRKVKRGTGRNKGGRLRPGYLLILVLEMTQGTRLQWRREEKKDKKEQPKQQTLTRGHAADPCMNSCSRVKEGQLLGASLRQWGVGRVYGRSPTL